ncbi:Protein of unknown function DUF58 [Ruminococcaceae bacterium YAD3003]|nr:Protein of unknown function DUF58 [Ruminococcaceae bacterium YAD3003]
MLRTWLTYSVALIGTFIFFLCYKMWVSWYCLVVLLALPVISIIICIVAANTMVCGFNMPKNLRIGDEAYITMKTSGFATFLSNCKVKMIIRDEMGDSQKYVTVKIHDNGVSKIPLDTSHCGAYSFKVNKLIVYDLLGFFRLSVKIEKADEVLVKPVPVMPEIMPDRFGFKAKNLRKAKQPNSEIYDVKEYAPGDPIKSIHWKVSAKKDKLYVKEALEEYGGHSRVLLKLTNDRSVLDEHLGQLLFTSKYFLDREVSHKVRVIPPDQSEIAFNIESTSDLERAMVKILHLSVPKEVPLEE